MDEAGDRCPGTGRPRRDVLSRGRAILWSPFRRGAGFLELRRAGARSAGRIATRSRSHLRSVVWRTHCGSVRGAISGPGVIVNPRVGTTTVMAAGRAGLVLSAISLAADAAFLSRVASTVRRDCDR